MLLPPSYAAVTSRYVPCKHFSKKHIFLNESQTLLYSINQSINNASIPAVMNLASSNIISCYILVRTFQTWVYKIYKQPDLSILPTECNITLYMIILYLVYRAIINKNKQTFQLARRVRSLISE